MLSHSDSVYIHVNTLKHEVLKCELLLNMSVNCFPICGLDSFWHGFSSERLIFSGLSFHCIIVPVNPEKYKLCSPHSDR